MTVNKRTLETCRPSVSIGLSGYGSTASMDYPFYPTRGICMETPSINKTLNEGGINLDPEKETNKMEDNPPSQSTLAAAGSSAPKISSSSLEEVLHSKGEEIEEEAVKVLDSGTLKQKRLRLPGSSKRNLRKLMGSGVPYETALKQVLDKFKTPSEESAMTSKPLSKRVHSDGSTLEQLAKKPKPAETQPTEPIAGSEKKLNYKAAVSGIRVGLIHPDYPAQQFNVEQVRLLRREVISAVDNIKKVGVRTQVRFESCAMCSGWLLVTCADACSKNWLVNTAKNLHPWEGAQIKAVVGSDIPRPHVCVAFIPDDVVSVPLTKETVLTRLEVMNNSLHTSEWTVLNTTRSGPGHTWTFAVDEVSVKALEELCWRPYFGFGRIQFRLKGKGVENPTPTVEKTEAVTVAPSTSSAPAATSTNCGKISAPTGISSRGRYTGTRSAPRESGGRGKFFTPARGSRERWNEGPVRWPLHPKR
ncbi:uncharacterized protein [Onthophagus taurus]|uniref:uncharacterized protein isoform X1 n=1 Tax=Onthophagus taurus TaxID=166361 RepID=UPI0039BDDEF5